ncbi:MAG: hypothetical protein JWO86_2766 [Myxococcaceae bacterium]|jgi:hypothetical protein|nr:hypothetical protein [Myxococcaceae bacterium]
MKRTTLVIASSIALGVLSLVACSSTDSGTGAGPTNKPPTTTPDVDSGVSTNPTTDGGPTVDGSSSGATCTGPTFDNARIPGWPTVPQP